MVDIYTRRGEAEQRIRAPAGPPDYLITCTQMLARVRASAEWRFLGVLPTAASGLTAAWWAMVVARGVLPAGFAIAMGATVGAVQSGRSLTLPLAATAVVFIGMSAMGPVHEAVGASLGAQVSAWLHQRLLDVRDPRRHRPPRVARPGR
jgi:hypothetical protein